MNRYVIHRRMLKNVLLQIWNKQIQSKIPFHFQGLIFLLLQQPLHKEPQGKQSPGQIV